jgi:hypothetical protein
LNVGLEYKIPTHASGEFVLEGQYTDILKHTMIMYPGDPTIDLLTNPFYSTEFKSKENISVTWNYAKLSTTLYVEHYGQTPNYAAQQTALGYDVPFGGTARYLDAREFERQIQPAPGPAGLREHRQSVRHHAPA